MAMHRTCSITCDTLCSVTLSSVPLAILSAAMIGYLVGKLASPRQLATAQRSANPPSGGHVLDWSYRGLHPPSESCMVQPGPHSEAIGSVEQVAQPAIVDLQIPDPGTQLQISDYDGFYDGNSQELIHLHLEPPAGEGSAPRYRSDSPSSSTSGRSALMELQGKRSTRSPGPTGPSPGSPRTKKAEAASASGDGSFHAPTVRHVTTETPGALRKPATMRPVSIPISQSAYEVGTPQSLSPDIMDEATTHPNTNQEDHGRIPSIAWMSGADAVDGKLECQLSWLDLVEHSLEEIYGQRWMDSVHPQDYEQCKREIFEAFDGRRPYRVQYRLQIETGSFRWVMDVGKPRISRSDRRFLGYVGWRMDIHESKTIEHDYGKYWILPHEILVKCDPHGLYFETASPSFPRLLGYTMEEFLKIKYLDLIHPDDVQNTMDQFHKLTIGEPVTRIVNRYRCNPDPAAQIEGPCFVDSTGSYKWINWTANHFFGAGRDITPEKQAQLELQRSQEELRRITDAIPGGVFQYRVDDDGVQSFPFISKGAMHMYSSEEDGSSSPRSDKTSPNTDDMEKEMEHYGFHNDGEMKLRLRVHPEDWPKLKEAMRQSSLSGSSLDFDYRLVRGDEVRWVRVHAVPLAREEGGQDWCGITWDMTEQHLAEAALRAERDNAEKLSQAKGAFLATMSHEIRTPMNAVLGMGALLLDTQLTDEQRDYVSTIRSSGEALLAVINDILDFSKIEAGKLELEVALFDMCDCIEDSLDLVTPQAASKGLELTCTICDTVPVKLKADSGRLRQILVNLLSNAIKFTPQGSVSIDVDGQSVLSTPEPEIRESSLRTDNFCESSSCTKSEPSEAPMWKIHVVVKDTGIGIPEDRKHALFQPFSQVDASTTRRYGGTGLGLAICARLTALLGGQIWIESSEAQGSSFHFTFVAEAVTTAEGQGEEPALACLQNQRVLLASDNSSTQTMVLRFLRSWRTIPVAAFNATEALTLVQTALQSLQPHAGGERYAMHERFNVVILDCTMLEAQDPELLECLRIAKDASPTIPVILLTPFGRKAHNYAKAYPKLKFDAFVLKPVKASVLLNALMSLLVKDGQGNPEQNLVTDRGSTTATMDGNIGKECPLRILIAEDNVINQKVLVRLLLRHGYSAEVVANGLEAVDAALRQRYDVILMDCFMPEMDGLEATRQIRRKLHPCPVIVAVTAAALEDERQACQLAGMHMYIAKPIQAKQLVSVLRQCWRVKDEKLDPDGLQAEGFNRKHMQ